MSETRQTFASLAQSEMTMYGEAVKTSRAEGCIRVSELSELVPEAVVASGAEAA